MSDVKFGYWTVPESPVSIDYSLVLIEEIRHEVAEGFQRLSRGGIEVGGILYGTRDGRTVRALAIRPIACEHARGPAFVLSDKDRAALKEQLEQDRQDHRLEESVPVGWYVSHTRSEIALADSDVEIYSTFFPAPWQVTLVIRPGRAGSMRAGFFVREADGTVKSERAYLEFNFPDRLAGVFDRAADRPYRERGADRRVPALHREPTSALPARREQPRVDVAPYRAPKSVPAPPPRRSWLLLLGWAALVLTAAVGGLRYWVSMSTPDPIALSVAERQGQLQIEWNHAAKPVAAAKSGALDIVDGATTLNIPLTPEVLATGKFTYVRTTGDVEVRMTVEDANGTRAEEASRFLGRPPVGEHSDELKSLEQRRTELEAEIRRLRRENEASSSRVQQLERTLRILQARLGIEEK
jgi:hypothetical protein